MASKSISLKGSSLTKRTFPVLEMTCAACAVSVESMLKSAKGVRQASVNYANQTALVEFDGAETSPVGLQQVVRSIGYDLVVEEDPQLAVEEAKQKAYRDIQIRTVGSILLTLPVIVLGMFFMEAPYSAFASMVLSAPVVFYFGRGFFVHAWKQATHRKANMDTLVALSTGIAFLFSVFNTFFPEFWHQRGLHAHVYYEAAAVVVAFVSLGKWLEERAKNSTGSAIRKLMGLQPKTVRVIREEVEIEIPAADVRVNDVISVRPGEKVPVDGLVSWGHSFVDESMISGEPVAVEKTEGNDVFAGTINQRGSFHFRATKVGSETVLAQIIRMVQEAQGSKAPVQKLVDQVAGIFVPVVMSISLLTFIAWMIWGGEHAFTHALLTSVTVLVIACPCALGLATPTAIMVGVGRGAENHILIKDAESLELAHRVNAIVLDKTGTLTEGKPSLDGILWNESISNHSQFAGILFAIEKQSEHPLAQAVVACLEKADTFVIQDFQSVTGRGAEGKFDGVRYRVGTLQWMEDEGLVPSDPLRRQAEAWSSEAKTVVWFADEKQVLAVLALTDRLKKTSKDAVASLRKKGIDVYMVTGDHRATAEAVGREVGIEHVVSHALPATKYEFVKDLQARGKVVAMVGDGINDSQALAQADVSIAMGKGTDIAMDVAKMTLITSDLSAIARALKLSSRTVATIRQNLFWAFIYNVIGIPLAAGVLYPVNGFLLDPMIAGGAMALSSVSVVTNSLRLRWAQLED